MMTAAHKGPDDGMPQAADALWVEHVLESLRTAKAPAGLEERVLARVLDSLDQPAPATWRTRLASFTHLPLQSAAAGLCAAVLAAGLLALRHHTPATGQPVADAARQSPAAQEAMTAPAQTIRPRHSTARQALPESTTVANSPDALAAGDASEPGYGYPAPPMPMTEQERLLVLVARSRAGEGASREAALVVPVLPGPDRLPHPPAGSTPPPSGLDRLADQQAAADQQQRAEFDSFFPRKATPPTPEELLLSPDNLANSAAPAVPDPTYQTTSRR